MIRRFVRRACEHHHIRVVITGAAGRIGRCLMEGLSSAGHDVRGIDVVAADGDVVVADLAHDADVLAGLMDGAEAVVHLAAIASETDFSTAVDSHIGLTHGVLEAAVAHQVGRVVYASSNHAVGFAARTSLLPADSRASPDSFYGFGKAACEALCSLYHSRYDLAVACLRIGSFRDRPTTRRHLSTWLSPGDAVRLVDACLRSPDLGFADRVRHLAQHPRMVGPGLRSLARLRAARRRRAVGRRDRAHAAHRGRRPRRTLRRRRLRPEGLRQILIASASRARSGRCR